MERRIRAIVYIKMDFGIKEGRTMKRRERKGEKELQQEQKRRERNGRSMGTTAYVKMDFDMN